MSGYYLTILQGALLTVGVSLCALFVSVLLGLLGAAAKLSGRKLWGSVAHVYTTLVRGVPELVLMLLVYYGATIGLNQLVASLGFKGPVNLDPFTAGVLTIGFIYGAYMTETFRGAILSIPKGQSEAAWACGMGPVRTYIRIILPQMVRYALPGFTNNWLVLIKATALVSLIGLQDMTFLAKQASAATREPFVFLLFAGALFLLYTSASLWCLQRLSARYAMGVKRKEV